MSEQISIGALWLKESKNGNKYMSGVIESEDLKINKMNIVVFKNSKSKDSHPDYKIFLSEPRQQKTETSISVSSEDIPF